MNICHTEMAVRCTEGSKQLELCRGSVGQLKILTGYSLYIQETILYVKEKCNCAIKKEVHTCNTIQLRVM
jgi:hypothetical protein